MHASPPLRRIPLVIPILSAVALLAVCCSSTATAAVSSSQATSPKLAGKWSGHYSGAFSGTFTLRWTQSGSKLSGSIVLSRPAGTYPITGTVHGSTIAFGAVGAGATYTGSVSGTSMSGRYKAAGTTGGTWSAHKTS